MFIRHFRAGGTCNRWLLCMLVFKQDKWCLQTDQRQGDVFMVVDPEADLIMSVWSSWTDLGANLCFHTYTNTVHIQIQILIIEALKQNMSTWVI